MKCFDLLCSGVSSACVQLDLIIIVNAQPVLQTQWRYQRADFSVLSRCGEIKYVRNCDEMKSIGSVDGTVEIDTKQFIELSVRDTLSGLN
jgi:hypothetical protein